MGKRGALKVINSNAQQQQPIVGTSNDLPTKTTETSSSQSKTPSSLSKSKTAAAAVPSPVKPRGDLTAIERKAEFDFICTHRVAHDHDGGLAELGVQPWSFDDFEFVRKLGSGACATVYGAKEKQSGHEVALKIQDSDAAECYFDDEVDVHEPLDHLSIVIMIDYFYSDIPPPFVVADKKSASPEQSSSPTSYLCMILELCNGRDLFDTMKASTNGRLDEKTAASYFKSALNSIEYIHAAEVIHCDIKPSNFMVHGDAVKLADFGMAVRSEEREIIGGSPIYMSPEHVLAWRKDTDDFDHRVDIYSLGVVLFEILIGDVPYEVIEDDADMADYVFLAGLDKLAIGDDNRRLPRPLLDLRKLDDEEFADEPFVFPSAPVFPDFVSDEAKDLITRLMEPCADKRITVAEARDHAWLQKF